MSLLQLDVTGRLLRTVYIDIEQRRIGKAFDGLSTAATPERKEMKKTMFPPGWDEEWVRKVLAHYKEQTEEEAVAEDEAAFEGSKETVMEVPKDLVPTVRDLIAKRRRVQPPA